MVFEHQIKVHHLLASRQYREWQSNNASRVVVAEVGLKGINGMAPPGQVAWSNVSPRWLGQCQSVVTGHLARWE